MIWRGVQIAVMLGLSALGLLSPAWGQQVFPAGIDLVAVDVTVVDKRGRPLTDLRPEDFTVEVGGEPRRVVAARLVTRATTRSEPIENAAAPVTAAAPPAFSSNREIPRGRLIVLVFDLGFMDAGGCRPAAQAAQRFVEKLMPQDRVALVTIPSGPKVDFTTDHVRVKAALGTVRGGSRLLKGSWDLSLGEAYGIGWNEAIRRECGRMAGPGCVRALGEEARSIKTFAQAVTDASIDSLTRLLAALRPVEGPKTIVLVSQGLVTGARGSRVKGLTEGSVHPSEVHPGPAVGDSRQRLDMLADEVARARASLYTIFVDRSLVNVSDASEMTSSLSRLEEGDLLGDGLQLLAGSTGGPLFKTMTTFDFAFERVALETSAVWLLSFEPGEKDRDGKPHAIRVKVARRGVELRARPRFVVDKAEPQAPGAEARARRSLDALLPDVDVPLTVTTFVLNGTGEDVRLLVAAEVGLETAEGTAVGQRLIDMEGRVVTGTITIGGLEPVRSPNGAALYGLFTIPVRPGRYALKLAVATPSGRAGSIERTVDARLRPAGSLLLSDLVVADRTRRESGTMATVDGRLLGRSASVLLEVAGAQVTPAVQFELTPERGGAADLVEAASVRPRDQPGRFDAAALLNLAAFAAGRYELRAIVFQDGQEIGRAARAIELLPESTLTAGPQP
jgi:VWFA-related protein